jgi:hypothetical protein
MMPARYTREAWPCECGLSFVSEPGFTQHKCQWKTLFRKSHLGFWVRLQRRLRPERFWWRCARCGYLGRSLTQPKAREESWCGRCRPEAGR